MLSKQFGLALLGISAVYMGETAGQSRHGHDLAKRHDLEKRAIVTVYNTVYAIETADVTVYVTRTNSEGSAFVSAVTSASSSTVSPIGSSASKVYSSSSADSDSTTSSSATASPSPSSSAPASSSASSSAPSTSSAAPASTSSSEPSTTSSSSSKPSSASTTSSSAPSSSSSSSSSSLSSDMQALLDKTNEDRAAHDASPLTWSDELASYANSYASKCVFAHSGGPYGENLAMGTSLSAVDAVNMWYDENTSYDYSNPTFSSATGHYTQLVWKSTTTLGCALVNCPSLGGNYVVCEYSPAGNFLGQFAQNVAQ